MTDGPRKFCVARKVFPDVVDRLREHFDVETNAADAVWPHAELIARLQGKAGAFITGSERIDAELLDANPQLRAVCNMAVGYNNIDVPACTARGVLVTNTPDVLTETTADFGFALMMAAARRIAESEHFLRARRVDASGPTTCSPAATCTARRSASSAWAASARRSRGAARSASACR